MNRPPTVPPNALHLLLLTLILLLAAAGRVLYIDAESLWVDEGFSYWAIRQPDLWAVVLRDVHPPLYFLMLDAWAQATGISELALRYFSALPSVLSVAAVYGLARAILRGLPDAAQARLAFAPLLVALMLALADMENYIAQEARMYAWHVLWVTLSMWGFVGWVNGARLAPRLTLSSPWAAWVVASLLLLYTQYLGLAALAAQGLVALVMLRGRARLVALGTLAGVGLLFAPWLLVVVADQTANVGTGFNVPSTLDSLWQWRDEWFSGQWALLGGLALLGAGALLLRDRRAGLLAVGWVVLPVAGAYVLNFTTPILMDYRLTQITPAIALLMGFGLAALPAPPATRAFLVAVIVVYGVAIDDTPRPRPPWREVGVNAARYAQPGDLALAHVTPSGDWQVIYYYDRFMPPGVEKRSLRQWQLEDGATYAAGLPALLAEHPHVWFMHWSSDTSGFAALAATGHTQTAVMSEDWLGNALNVYRFDIVPPEAEAVARFDNGMVLRDVALYPEALRVDLWWSAGGAVEGDYTVSARVLDAAGRLVAQVDSGPFDGARPTSGWGTGEVVYDPRPMLLIDGLDALPPGDYTVAVLLYQWTPDGIREVATDAGAAMAVVGTFTR